MTPTLHAIDRFDVVQKRRVTTRMTDTVLQTHDGGVDFPSIKVSAHSEVTSVDGGVSTGEGQIDDAVMLEDVIDPKVRLQLARTLDKLKGQRFTWRMSSAEQTGDFQVPEAVRRVSEFSVQMPAEPLGLGADWTVDDAPVIDGIHWRRHSSFHVRELTEQAATLDVTTQMRAESQALSVEPNATTRLTSASGTANGSTTIRFGSALAASDMHSLVEMNLLIVRGHARVQSSVTSENWWTVTPRE